MTDLNELNPKYLQGLSPSQRVLQAKLIRQSQKKYEQTGKVEDRKEVSEGKVRRSPWVKKFEEKYGFPITDLKSVRSEFPDVDVDGILKKGYGAYMTSGSRPNVTSHQWAFSRLASALLGGPASKIDAKELGKK